MKMQVNIFRCDESSALSVISLVCACTVVGVNIQTLITLKHYHILKFQ